MLFYGSQEKLVVGRVILFCILIQRICRSVKARFELSKGFSGFLSDGKVWTALVFEGNYKTKK